MCVCVRERETGKERGTGKERERETGREKVKEKGRESSVN